MPREYKLKKPQPPESVSHSDPESKIVPIDFAKELNAEQLAAVTSPPGQALVIAGAGSGKTRTLTYRVAYLLQNSIAAHNILLLTFTNKAAKDLLERVEQLVPGRSGGLWGGTFHSVCNRILRRHPNKVGLDRNFTILDSEDQKSLVSKILKERTDLTELEKTKHRKFPKAPVLIGFFSLAANTGRTVREVAEIEFSADDDILDVIREIHEAYTSRKQQSNAVDFDDLMILTLKLFLENEDILADYQYQFQFILVDEYQDTNRIQGELVDLLAKSHGNLMVVGDDAQSIYSWRGADFRYIISFPERYPKANVYNIETNYRSIPEVLRLANDSISQNTEQFAKELKAARSNGAKPVMVPLYDSRQQAQFISQRIEEVMNEQGYEYRDIAVLYRAHFQSMEIQMQLTTDRVPFVITSGLRFFEQAHIKDFTSFLRIAVNPMDESAFDRLVKMLPGVGDSAAAKLWSQWQQSDFARAKKFPVNISERLLKMKVPGRAQEDWNQMAWTMDEFVLADGELVKPEYLMKSVYEGIYKEYLTSNYDNAEQREQDLTQFRQFGSAFENLSDMLSELSLVSGPEAAEATAAKDGNSVTLSSIHQAKGLEWKCVFLVSVGDALFPSPKAVEKGGEEALEEERRLFYVAVTRAMDQLYLTYPRSMPRAHDGGTSQGPSMFISELKPSLMDRWRIG